MTTRMSRFLAISDRVLPYGLPAIGITDIAISAFDFYAHQYFAAYVSGMCGALLIGLAIGDHFTRFYRRTNKELIGLLETQSSIMSQQQADLHKLVDAGVIEVTVEGQQSSAMH